MAVYEPSGYHISDLVQVNVIPTFNIIIKIWSTDKCYKLCWVPLYYFDKKKPEKETANTNDRWINP